MTRENTGAEQKQSLTVAWAWLLVAAVFEVIFALGSAANGGFTKAVPSVITVVAGGGGVYLLSLALKTIDVGIGYTVWTGIGTVGSVLFAALLYGEQITLGKVLCILAIIGGVVGLHLTSEKPKDDDTSDTTGSADDEGPESPVAPRSAS
ncbi:multidrug efflux SMR transporter [Streptomyces lydicamycinicus]|uniref:Multidrug resistance protein SugE n=1 Tax=Streptomyces lydicamycinicus TaxID=1546107 RepID=A0A0P4R4I7_9ACTN|nr:multidrug efflux SMR transporter [Streptomyces lydicamycinicus]USA02393.1 multidrug efflux SMR transporter [Streptomyces lydicamycinicus]GAO07408.1 multidrug resistance protein SugE [Streptomyces lydicamycinicus]